MNSFSREHQCSFLISIFLPENGLQMLSKNAYGGLDCTFHRVRLILVKLLFEAFLSLLIVSALPCRFYYKQKTVKPDSAK